MKIVAKLNVYPQSLLDSLPLARRLTVSCNQSQPVADPPRMAIFLNKDESLNKYAKKKILSLCNINLGKVIKFAKENTPKLMMFNSKEEIQKLIDDFKAR